MALEWLGEAYLVRYRSQIVEVDSVVFDTLPQWTVAAFVQDRHKKISPCCTLYSMGVCGHLSFPVNFATVNSDMFDLVFSHLLFFLFLCQHCVRASMSEEGMKKT